MAVTEENSCTGFKILNLFVLTEPAAVSRVSLLSGRKSKSLDLFDRPRRRSNHLSRSPDPLEFTLLIFHPSQYVLKFNPESLNISARVVA